MCVRVCALACVCVCVGVHGVLGAVGAPLGCASAEAAAAGPDPYVSWDVAMVDYGSTGSFAIDDNGLTFDETGLVTGVNVPFAMTLAPNTPNNHRVVVR